MKLKTLKDMKECLCCGCHLDDAVPKSDLKHEAIKWIKELQTYDVLPNLIILGGSHFQRPKNKNTIKINDKEFHFNNKNYIQVRDLLIEWIKHFFNISEKDLEVVDESPQIK